MSELIEILQSAQAEGVGTSDDRKRWVQAEDTIFKWSLTACLVLLPMVLIMISWFVLHLVGWEMRSWLYAVLFVMPIFLIWKLRYRIPQGYVGIPTLFDKRRDWFLFDEGNQWVGIFGVVLMPKKIFSSDASVATLAKDKTRMIIGYKFQWFIYNSLGHSQLDHSVKMTGDMEKDELSMRHADEGLAQGIIGAALVNLSQKHTPEELMSMDTTAMTDEIIEAIRKMPGEGEEGEHDLRVKVLGLEFIREGFIVYAPKFADSKMHDALESRRREKGEKSGQEVQLSSILMAQKRLEKAGADPETAFRIASINAGLPGITLEDIRVTGSNSALVRAAAINGRS